MALAHSVGSGIRERSFLRLLKSGHKEYQRNPDDTENESHYKTTGITEDTAYIDAVMPVAVTRI